MDFDEIVREIVSDDRTAKVPLVYIVHILMVAANHGFLKERENVSK